MTARLPALEAVAEAARAIRRGATSATGGWRLEEYLMRALDRALARLDATPAAQSPTPTPTPTDEELFKIEESVRLEWQRDRIGNYNMRVIRALYNAGAAAERERIRVAFANCDAHCRSRMAQDIIDDVPRVNEPEEQ